MSLIVVLSNELSLCVAADTRSVSTRDGPLLDPVKKLRIIQCGAQPVLLAAAGDVMIDGVHLLDHAQQMKNKLNGETGPEQLLAHLKEAWTHDVETFAWDSDSDKADYIEHAQIAILIASSFNSISIVNGKYDALTLNKYQPPMSIHALGMPNLVMDHIKHEAEYRANWKGFLINVFSAASAKSHFVAAPIDLAVWAANGVLSLERCSTSERIGLSWFI